MKLQRRELPASVLATVLVVGTLLLLGVLMVMNLWEMDVTRYYLYHRNEQSRLHAESGFLLYSRDSTLMDRLDVDSTVVLFAGKEDSRVGFRRERWGMYEVVHVRTVGGKKTSIRLVGKVWESDRRATLYIPENDRSVSLTGKTFLEGELYLPRNGVSYTQMRSEFFRGVKIKKERLKTSGRDFPEKDGETCREMDRMLSYPGVWDTWEGLSLKQSFREPVLWVETGEYLAGARVEGHVILYSPGNLFIEQNTCLENIIVIARKVEIADGFTGSLQVFARDSILLGDGVCLKSGSGLHVSGGEETSLVQLGENNEINGFVIVEGALSAGERKKAVYYQPETSRVRGLVFVEGIAEVHGMITGSLYVRDTYYFAPEGYYSQILYNVVLPGNPGIAYPFFLEGPHERREVKWLD